MFDKIKKALIVISGAIMVSVLSITPSFASERGSSEYTFTDKYPSAGDWEDGERNKHQNTLMQNSISAGNVNVDESGAQKTTVPYTGLTYTHNKRYDKCTVVNGIDVSKWNGDINWNKAKKHGIEFAFIRVGNRGVESGELYEDPLYKTNIKGANAAGIKVGVYIYSQAITEAEAIEEAKFVLKRIKAYNITMPVVFDLEYYDGPSGRLWDANLSKSQATKICQAFCKTVENAGYEAMLYSNPDMLYNHLNASTLEKECTIWLAHWGIQKTSYEGMYDYWQYGSGYVNGINGPVDVNFWYNPKKSTGLKLSATSKTMNIGDKFKLTGEIEPAESTDIITWTTSNPVVAYVDQEGNVIAGNKGSATITATTTSGIKSTCKLTVNDRLSNYEVVLKDGTVPIYNGKAHTPAVTLRTKKNIVLSGEVNTPVNLRMGPSTDFSIITTLPVGTKVTVYNSFTNNDGGIWYSIKFTIDGKTYRGYVSAPYITAKSGKRTLGSSLYTVAYSNNVNAGNAVLTIKPASGSYLTETLTANFQIEPCNITETVIERMDDYNYTGSSIMPDIESKFEGKVLIKDKDYELSYNNNIGSGIATITITGKGNFKGSTNVNFKIYGNREYYIEGIGKQLYTGNTITPQITIRNKETGAIIDNSNFTITYANNVEIGLATVNIEGNSEWEGSTILTFEIVSKLGNDKVITVYNVNNYEYTGSEIKPDIKVMCNGEVAPESAYSIEYLSNTNAGTATVVVTAKDGYTGKYSIDFDIVRSDISGGEYKTNSILDVVYTGDLLTPQIILENSYGMLIKDIDYTAIYENNINVGKGIITLKGIGNYKGTKIINFNVIGKSILLLTYKEIPNQVYQAKSITPEIVIMDGKYTLVKNKDYTVKYSSNVNVGTAKLVVTGMGNYTGTVTKTFKIQARGMTTCIASAISDRTYTGKKLTPSVSVKYGTYKLKLNKDYTIVKYSSNKNIGNATIILQGKGNFTGNMTINFNIIPKKISNFKASDITSSQIKLSWKKDSLVTGYEIYRSEAYDGTFKKIRTITNNKNISYTNKGLLNGKEYYYKIRSYKIVKGKTYYGKFTSVKSVSTKEKYTKYVVIKDTAYIRGHAGKNYKGLLKVKKGKEMTYLSYTYDSSKVKWYKVRYKYKNKTYTGYVRNDKAEVESVGKVKADVLNVRKSASVKSKKVTSIKQNTKIRITNTVKDSNGSKWYKIRYSKKGKKYTGYVMAKYVKIV
ncbi:MAG: hypothetical protein E7270_04565 [Lachnospiraceae bacterium]|nr:hypothetical protein [Lachnospiraceae bacterium]